MKITYDHMSDAVYIYLQDKSEIKKDPLMKTSGEYPVNIDYSKRNRIIGIEILHASKIMDLKSLKTLEFIDIHTKHK